MTIFRFNKRRWFRDRRSSFLRPATQETITTQVTTGIVIGVKIVVEGSVVTVLSREPGELFDLSADDQDEWLAVVATIECGDIVPVDELSRSLRKLQ